MAPIGAVQPGGGAGRSRTGLRDAGPLEAVAGNVEGPFSDRWGGGSTLRSLSRSRGGRGVRRTCEVTVDRRIINTLLCALALLSSAGPSFAQAERQDTAEARRFAQAFYDWYVPFRLSNDSAPQLTVRQKPGLFAPPLLRALRENFTAGPDAIDGDPFLAAQDPCEKYQVGTSVWRRGDVRVNVQSVCRGKVTTPARVVAVLRRTHRSWQFVDFDYPGTGKPGNPLGVLKDLKEP